MLRVLQRFAPGLERCCVLLHSRAATHIQVLQRLQGTASIRLRRTMHRCSHPGPIAGVLARCRLRLFTAGKMTDSQRCGTRSMSLHDVAEAERCNTFVYRTGRHW